MCAWRWVRSQRSWRPISTWSSRSAAVSCLSPAPAALGSGDRNQPVGLRACEWWNYQWEIKFLCWPRTHEHIEWKGKSKKFRGLKKAGPQFIWWNLYTLLQSTTNPAVLWCEPSLNAGTTVDGLQNLHPVLIKNVHLVMFSMNVVWVVLLATVQTVSPLSWFHHFGDVIVNSSVRVTLRDIFKSQGHWQPCIYLFVCLFIYLFIEHQPV